jgi:hypothetical protein
MCFLGHLYSQHQQPEKAKECYARAMGYSDRVRDPYWGLLAYTDPKSKDAYDLAEKASSIERSIYFDSNPGLYNEESNNKLQGLMQQWKQLNSDALGRPQITIDPRELVPPVRF